MLWDPEPEWKILLKSRTLRVDHWGCFPGKRPSLLPQSPWKPREWAALFSNEHWALLGFSLGPPPMMSVPYDHLSLFLLDSILSTVLW